MCTYENYNSLYVPQETEGQGFVDFQEKQCPD
jgi:hypothetical protein